MTWPVINPLPTIIELSLERALFTASTTFPNLGKLSIIFSNKTHNMRNYLVLTFLLISNLLFSQVPCGSIVERVPIPSEYSTNTPLPPDPCDALADYGTEKVLTVSTQPEYLEIKKKIRVVVETLIDPDNCTSVAHELSRDTIEISREKIYAASTVPVGGYWTVRMELLMFAPASRPAGCYATKLPEGALSQKYKDGSTIEINEYWVVHSGQYETKAEASAATKRLKSKYPEFCRAYAYMLPEGCQNQYQYKSSSFNN